jgi:hypothetical protein
MLRARLKAGGRKQEAGKRLELQSYYSIGMFSTVIPIFQFMKKVLLIFFCTIMSVQAFCQSRQIEFEGGDTVLYKLLLKSLKIVGRETSDSTRYFDVLMNINKSGHIDQVIITSVYDSANAGPILTAIKKTQDKWINHSGKDLWVNIPFYLYYLNENDVVERNPKIQSRQFVNWETRMMVTLPAVNVQVFPTMH